MKQQIIEVGTLYSRDWLRNLEDSGGLTSSVNNNNKIAPICLYHTDAEIVPR